MKHEALIGALYAFSTPGPLLCRAPNPTMRILQSALGRIVPEGDLEVATYDLALKACLYPEEFTDADHLALRQGLFDLYIDAGFGKPELKDYFPDFFV